MTNDPKSTTLLDLGWHPTKNLPLEPSSITFGSSKKVWWLGKDCGHEWQASPNSRSYTKNGCPYCSHIKVLPGYNDLATLNPAIADEWHPTKNYPSTPNSVAQASSKKVRWLGSICGHEWDATIANRVYRKSGCPYCAGKRTLVGFNDFGTLYPDLVKDWHPTKNIFKPNAVTAGSSKKVWWLGEACRHEWQTTVKSRKHGTGCPICSNNKIIQGVNDFKFLDPITADEWHPIKNGALLPTEISKGSNVKVWWLGKTCQHEWQANVADRSNKGYGCPYCQGKKVMTGFNDIATTNPHFAMQWHPTKNIFSAKELSGGSSKKIWWICKKGHEWLVAPNHRTSYKTECPECATHIFISRDEQLVADFIVEHKLTIVQSDNKTVKGHELDIYIPSKKIAIEYNGLYWHTENQGRDKKYHHNKYLACKNLGIQLIQVWEDEWRDNPEQIKSMLLHKLGVSQQEKVFARKTYITELKKKEIESYLEQHHVQGYASGSYYLGLREKDNDELISVLVLKKEPKNSLNIIRYATSKQVVGGFTKLLKYAEINYKPSSFITFSDHCVSDGGLYANNGFTVDKLISPDYRYVVNGQRQHKFGYRLKRFRDDPNLQWDENMTERELAALNGIQRIWDAGKTRWVYVCS